MLDYVEIGKRIRALRKERNLSQEQLAERIWISTTHMSHIETGNTKLSLPVLVDLAQALGVGMDELLALNMEKRNAANSVQEIMDTCTPRQAKVIEAVVKAVKENME